MRARLWLFGAALASRVEFDRGSAFIDMQSIIRDLCYPNQSRCIPEVTDKKCKKLGRIDNSYVADCVIVLWDHESYNGNLKVTKHRSDEKKCILAYRDRRFQNRLSNKEDKFKNLCLGSFWATWAEWTTVPRKSRPNGQITQSRRRKCDRSELKRLPSRIKHILPDYMRKCEGRKIEFRHIKVSRERTDQSVWSQWSAWSSCSVTCGNGLSVRRRRCLSETCIGFDQVSRDCNLSSCSVPTRPPLNCGNISEGCGLGECITPLSGQSFCQCWESATNDDTGSCVPKPEEIDAELPKSYDECDQWEFLIDGRPMSDAECRGSG